MSVNYKAKTIDVSVADEQQAVYVRPGDSIKFNFSFDDVKTKIVDGDLVINFNGGGGSITVADFGSLALANDSDPIKIFDENGNQIDLSRLVTGEGQWFDSEGPSYLIIRDLSSAESSKPVGESLASAQDIVDDDMDLVQKRGDVNMDYSNQSVLSGESEHNYVIRTLEYPTDVRYDFPTDYPYNNNKDKSEDMIGTLPTIVYRMKPRFNMYYGPYVDQKDPDVDFFEVDVENGGGLQEGSYLQYDPETIDFSNQSIALHYEGAKYPDSIFRIFHTNMKNSSALFLGGYVIGLPKEVNIVSTDQAPLVVTPMGIGSYQIQSSITSVGEFDMTLQYPLGMEEQESKVEIILFAYNVNTEAILFSDNTIKIEFRAVNGPADLADESSSTLVVSTVPDPIRMIGTEFNDVINGETAPLILDMGSGDDKVQGGDLDDIINLEDGDDVAYYSFGHDVIDGGKGYDSLEFKGIEGYTLDHINVIANRGLSVELVFNEADAPESNTEFSNIESLKLTGGNDVLTIVDTTGMRGELLIDGLGDTSTYYVHQDLSGVYGYSARAGSFSGDTIETDTTKDVYLDQENSRVSTDVSMIEYVEYVNFESFLGGDEDDTFRASEDGSMDFDGGGGDRDEDVVTYENLTSAIVYDYSQDGLVSKAGGMDHIRNFEILIGTKGNDVFYAGETGSTKYVGADGSNDILSYVNSKKGVVIDLGERTVGKPYNSSSPSSYTYEDSYDDTVEVIEASNHDDLFIGSDLIAMSMDGKDGDYDAVTYEKLYASVAVDFEAGTIIKTTGGTDDFLNVNAFTGSQVEDTFIMSTAFSTIVDGSEGNDTYGFADGTYSVNVVYDYASYTFTIESSGGTESQAKNIENIGLTNNNDTANFELEAGKTPVLNMDGADGIDTVIFLVKSQDYMYQISSSGVKTENFEIYQFDFTKNNSNFEFAIDGEFSGTEVTVDDSKLDSSILNLSYYYGGSSSNISFGTVNYFEFYDGDLGFTATGFFEYDLSSEDDNISFYADDLSFWYKGTFIDGGGGTNTMNFKNYDTTVYDDSGNPVIGSDGKEVKVGIVVDLGTGRVSVDDTSGRSFQFINFNSFEGTDADDFFLLDVASGSLMDIDGGDGNDYVSYRNQVNGMVLDVAGLTISYSNIEGYETTDNIDVINMSDAPDAVKNISGAEGNDTVNFVSFSNSVDFVIGFNDKGYIESSAQSNGEDYILIKIEKYNGTDQDDTFDIQIEADEVESLATTMVVDGREGDNSITFSKLESGIDVYFSLDGSAAVNAAGEDRHFLEMTKITNITMSDNDDVFYFSSTQSVIDTSTGAIIPVFLEGGAGDDTISFSEALGSMSFTVDSSGIINYGDEYHFSNFERIEGSIYDDVFIVSDSSLGYDLSGNAGVDILDMSAINDDISINTSTGVINAGGNVINFENFSKFITGTGDDTVVIDNDTDNLFIEFGDGTNVVDYSAVDAYSANITINGFGDVSVLRDGAMLDKDVYSDVSVLTGTANTDRIVLDMQGEDFSASGIVSIYGGGGKDSLIIRDATSGLSLVYDKDGNFEVNGSSSHIIGGFQSIVFTGFDDYVNINNTEIVDIFSSGLDLKAGEGDDVLSYAGYTNNVKVDLINFSVQRYNDTSDAVVSVDYFRDFEKIEGGEGNDTFILGDSVGSVTEIDGGNGDNDSISFENATGAVNYAPGSAGSGVSIKVSSIEAVTLTKYDDVATGNFTDEMHVSGASSSFTGDTLLYNGTGSESVTIDFTTSTGGYTTVVKSSGGTDTVAEFENLQLTNVVGHITISDAGSIKKVDGGGKGDVTIKSSKNASFDLASGSLLLEESGVYSQKIIRNFEVYNFESSNLTVNINMLEYDAAGFAPNLVLNGVAGGSYNLNYLNIDDTMDVTLDGVNTEVSYKYNGVDYTTQASYATGFILGTGDDNIVVKSMDLTAGIVYKFDGSEGVDTLDFSAFSGDFFIDNASGIIATDSNYLDVVGRVYNMENFQFGAGDQTLTGLTEGQAYDVDFGDGNDTISFASSSTAHNLIIMGGDVTNSTSTFRHVENVIGGAGGDSFLISDFDLNTDFMPNIDGGAGDDMLTCSLTGATSPVDYLTYNFGTGELWQGTSQADMDGNMNNAVEAKFFITNIEMFYFISSFSMVTVTAPSMYDGMYINLGGKGRLVLQGDDTSAAVLTLDSLDVDSGGYFSFSGVSGAGYFADIPEIVFSGNATLRVNDFGDGMTSRFVDMDYRDENIGTQTVELDNVTGSISVSSTAADEYKFNKFSVADADKFSLNFSRDGILVLDNKIYSDMTGPLEIDASGDGYFSFASSVVFDVADAPSFYIGSGGSVLELYNPADPDSKKLSIYSSLKPVLDVPSIIYLSQVNGANTDVHYGGFDSDIIIHASSDYNLNLDTDTSSHVFNVTLLAKNTDNTMTMDNGEMVWDFAYLRELTAVKNLNSVMNFQGESGGLFDIKDYTNQSVYRNISQVKTTNIYSSNEMTYAVLSSQQLNVLNAAGASAEFYSTVGALAIENVYDTAVNIGVINLVEVDPSSADFSRGTLKINFDFGGKSSTVDTLNVRAQDSAGNVVAGSSFVQNGSNFIIDNHMRVAFEGVSNLDLKTVNIGSEVGSFDLVRMDLSEINSGAFNIFYNDDISLDLSSGDITVDYSMVDIGGTTVAQLSIVDGSNTYYANDAKIGTPGEGVIELDFDVSSSDITINTDGVYEKIVFNMPVNITFSNEFMDEVVTIDARGRDVGFRGADPTSITGYADFVNPSNEDIFYTMYLDPAVTTTPGGSSVQLNTLNIDTFTAGTYMLDGSSSSGIKILDMNLTNTTGGVEVTLDSSGTSLIYNFVEGDLNLQFDDNTIVGSIQFGNTDDIFNLDYTGGYYMFNAYYGDSTAFGSNHPDHTHDAREIDMGDGFDTFNIGEFVSPTGATATVPTDPANNNMSLEFGAKRETINSSDPIDQSTITVRLATVGGPSTYLYLSNVEELNIIDTQVHSLAFNYSYNYVGYGAGDLGGNFKYYRPEIQKFSYDGLIKVNVKGNGINSMTTLFFLDADQRVISNQLDTGEVWANIEFGTTRIEDFLSTHSMSGDGTANVQGRLVLAGDVSSYTDYTIYVRDKMDDVFDVDIYISPEIFGIDYNIVASSSKVLVQNSSGSTTHLSIEGYAGTTLNYTELTYYTADFYRYNYMYARETDKLMQTDAFFQDSKAQAVEVLYDLYSYDGGNLDLFYSDLALYSKYMDEDVFYYIGVDKEDLEDLFRYADLNDIDINKEGLESAYDVFETEGAKGILEVVHDNTDGIKEFVEVTGYISEAVGQDIFKMAGISKPEYINHEYLNELKVDLDSDDVRVGLANFYNLVGDDEKFINIIDKISEFTNTDIFDFIGVSKEEFVNAMQKMNEDEGKDSSASSEVEESSNSSANSHEANNNNNSEESAKHNSNSQENNNNDKSVTSTSSNNKEEANEQGDFAFDMNMIGDSVDRMSVQEHFEESMIGSLNDAASYQEHTLNNNHHNSSSNSSGGIA